MFDVVDTSFSTNIFSEKKRAERRTRKKTFLISPFTLLVLLIFMYIFCHCFFLLCSGSIYQKQERKRKDGKAKDMTIIEKGSSTKNKVVTKKFQERDTRSTRDTYSSRVPLCFFMRCPKKNFSTDLNVLMMLIIIIKHN